jgi:hypothetical protein
MSSRRFQEGVVAERNERRLELLLGRKVHAQDGRVIGRIEEFHAEREHDYYVVTEYHVGRAALLERLSVRHLGFTLPGRVHGYRVRWDQLDLDDPDHPRLTCPVEEIRAIGPTGRARRPRRAG